MARDFDAVDDEIDCGTDTLTNNIWQGGGSMCLWGLPASRGESNAGRLFEKFVGGTGWRTYLLDESGSACNWRIRQNFVTTRGVWETANHNVTYDNWHLFSLLC